MKHQTLLHLLLLLTTLIVCSCGSIKDYNYFQDTAAGDLTQIANASQLVKAKPYDKLSILVTCKDPRLGSMFNLLVSNNRANQPTSTENNMNGMYISYYTVDTNGDVEIPVLGKLHVEGLTRSQIAEKVKRELTASEQGVKDATVTVEFANLHIGVLGEVKSQGIISIDRDQFTLLDAIARAGDLTQYGNRKDVKVFRKTDAGIQTYNVDMTNLAEVCASPVFMMQQDDIIYVSPTKVRARQSTTAGNTLLTPTFWVTVMSLGISIATFLK